ncbi:MAG TPA: translational GTPase TypA [Usitatibacter sp.]
MRRPLRNIAIIAHVDHGKTTLVDKLLQQAGTFAAHQHLVERVMDSGDIERERGITILAKNTAVDYHGVHINIVDTPGHADFGGEVERVLSMVDGVLLLVDAVEGPMPQTRFVTRKALAQGLKPILVVNKVDRDGARSDWVVDQTFDLMDKLGATEDQLDFPVIYASALNGWASTKVDEVGTDMRPLFDAVLKYVPEPLGDPEGPLQMQIAAVDYSSFLGRIAVGRIRRGSIKKAQEVAIMSGDKFIRKAKIGLLHTFQGLDKVETAVASAGEIVSVTGIEDFVIGTTFADPLVPEGLPMVGVDEPTLTMNFQVNTSPYAGQEGKYVTSRQLRERLDRELLANVALRVEETGDNDVFRVSGRGELHLTILIENMRREGYELAVGKPRVVAKEVDGVRHEPWENLTVDVDTDNQGKIMEELGRRGGELTDMVPDGKGRVRLDYSIPSRGLIGFHMEFMTLTRGTGIKSHVFEKYAPVKTEPPSRRNGVLISSEQGDAVAFALFNLEERGRMFVSPGERLYVGMVIGIHSRDNDLIVNPVKGKKLTNVRSAGKDENVVLTPPIQLTLESAVEFIEDDELVEVTPKSIRLRKRFLSEHDRKRDARGEKAA